MADLYVANCTTQHRMVCYRVPERKQLFQRMVKAGAQEVLLRGVTVDVVEAVVRQLEQYGAVPANEIPRAKAFVGLSYSLDRAVPVDRMMRANEQNIVILDQWGKELRKVAAVVNNDIADKVAREAGGRAVAFEHEVLEDVRRGETSAGKLASRIRVSEEAPSAPSGRRRKAA